MRLRRKSLVERLAERVEHRGDLLALIQNDLTTADELVEMEEGLRVWAEANGVTPASRG